MKTIGLIGGMSWESSLEYYRIINETVKQKLGAHHSCDSLMYSVDFDEIKNLQHAGEWEKLTEIMIDAARRLENGGAELLVICTNTMHLMAPDIEKKINIPLIHIADTTAQEIKSLKLSRVLLLGTRFTMEQNFYKGRLKKKYDIDVLIPDPKDIDIVHNIIYHELILGKVKDSSRDEYIRIINEMLIRGAQGVILGCTEIPLLIKQEDVSIPVFDTTSIHATKAVEAAIK